MFSRTKTLVERAHDASFFDALVSLLLRLGIAFSFLYPPIAAFLAPQDWIWFVPEFVETFLPREVFLQVFGLAEVAIAVGLLALRNPTVPAIAAIAVLGIIIVSDWSIFDITFRDVSILLMALALIVLHRKAAVIQ